MLSRIRDFITASLAQDQAPAHSAHGRHLAAAAVLIEVAQADYRNDPCELIAMREMLHRCFGLSHEELDTLLALAQAEAHEATSDYRFTRVINDEFTNTEKSALLRSMWQVAFADGNVDKYEEHLIRKIAALIYVPHSEFIRTKLEAGAAAQRS